MAKYKSKKAKLTKRKKFSFTLAFIFISAIVGLIGYRYYASHATLYFGGYVVDQNGRPAPGIKIWDCKGHPAVYTKADGTYANPYFNQYDPFCVNLDENALPPGYSNPRALRNNPGINDLDYNWQVMAAWCYQNFQYCGDGKVGGSWQVLYHDISYNNGADSGYDFAITYTDRIAPSAPSLGGSAASTSQINLSWSASSDNYSGIASYDVYRNGVKITSQGGTSYNNTGLAPSTTYSYFVKARDGAGNISGQSNTVSVKTQSSPTASAPSKPPASSSTSTTKPKGPTGATIATPGTQQIGDGTAPLGSASNFTASSNVIGVILNWTLSSGGKGEISYQIDRSVDNSNWENVASAAIGSTFVDTTAEYATHYFYRIRATDTSGGISEYAAVEITTDSFNPNAGPNNEQTFTSDDGIVSISIPTGALSQDAACSIVNQTSSQSINDTNVTSSLVAGPYLLVCKTSDDNLIQEFTSELTIKVSVVDELSSQYNSIKLVADENNEGKFTEVNAEFKADDKVFVYETNKVVTFGLTGSKKVSYTKYIVFAILGIVIVGLVMLIIKKKDRLIEWFYYKR